MMCRTFIMDSTCQVSGYCLPHQALDHLILQNRFDQKCAPHTEADIICY